MPKQSSFHILNAMKGDGDQLIFSKWLIVMHFKKQVLVAAENQKKISLQSDCSGSFYFS